MPKPKPSKSNQEQLRDMCEELRRVLYGASSRAQSALLPAREGAELIEGFSSAFILLDEIRKRLK